MRTRMLMSGALAATFAAGVLTQPETAWAADDAITVYCAGVDGILVDEKDQSLRRALHMLGDRLAELPEEIGDPSMPPGDVFKMLADVLLSPIVFRAGFIPGADPNEGPPFYAQIAIGADNRDTAKRRAMTALELMRQGMGPVEGEPHPDLPDITVIDLDGVPLYIGSTQAGGNSMSIVAINKLNLESPDLADLGLPAGVETALAMKFDGAAVAPFIEMMMQQMPPGPSEALRGQLMMFGLAGEDPMHITAAFGHDAQRAHAVMRYRNYVDNPAYSMLIVREPLTSRELNLVPADATVARVGHLKMSAFGDYFINLFGSMPAEQMGGMTPEGLFDMVEEQIGINPKTDLLDHLGQTWGYYMSGTTGGGGLLSTVMFAQVADEDAITETFDQLAGMVNEMAKERAKGYVRFRSRRIAGQEITTLSFPGLPIPLEISCAVEHGYLWVAVTPQALLGALKHVREGGAGLAANPRFRAMAGDRLASAFDVQWQDTPRLLAGGYGLVSLAASALSNGVLSPKNPDRDPGLVLPTFEELADGAQPAVALSWIEGNDLFYHAQMDRSMLVNLTGAVGTLGNSGAGLAVAAIGAAVLLPAVAKARMSAPMARSEAQLRQIHLAAETYRQATGEYPADFDALQRENFIIPALKSSPFGPVANEAGDYWFDFSGFGGDEWQRIIGYDRAAYAGERAVPVLFADGHVELLSIDEFLAAIDREPNLQVDFQLSLK